ncbi:MAG: CDP-alcohol phosphatidyltransferase family protein [Candidatus Woesearchaeota archaeon]
MPKKEKKAERVSKSLTWEIEVPVKTYLAKKLPEFIGPDTLTILGLISALIIGLCFYLSTFNKFWLLGSIFFLIVHWYADSLDGTVARIRKIEREHFGYFADHMADMFTIIFIMVGLGLSPLMDIYLALIFIIVYFLTSINVYLAAYTHGIFNLSMGKIGPTEIRILTILLIIAVMPFYPGIISIVGLKIKLFNISILIAAIGIFILTLISIIKNLRYLNEIDKKKYKEITVYEYLQKSEFMNKIKNMKLGNAENNEILNFFNSFSHRRNNKSKPNT